MMLILIELRDNDHVSLLFVDSRFQRHSLARELLMRAPSVGRPAKPGLDRVTVNSSRFGVPIYEKLGVDKPGPSGRSTGSSSSRWRTGLGPNPA